MLIALAVLLILPSAALAEEPSIAFLIEGPGSALVRGGQGERESIFASPLAGVYSAEYSCEPPSFETLTTPTGEEIRGDTAYATLTSQGNESGACHPEEESPPLEMNGCQFSFEPTEALSTELFRGKISLGPKGCGPIRSETIFHCPVSIAGQQLDASKRRIPRSGRPRRRNRSLGRTGRAGGHL
jgi:hypothetical protein